MSNSARRQLEPSLPASAVMTWYQVTLSAIGDAVLTTDPQGRVTSMTPVAESLTAWVEYHYAEDLTAAAQEEAVELTPESLAGWSQDFIDQLSPPPTNSSGSSTARFPLRWPII